MNPPDAILLDLRMPEIDGLEVMRRLKAIPQCANIPVIIATAYEDREAKREAFGLGAMDFLVKPFDLDEVALRVRNITQLYQYQKNLERLVEERTLQLRETLQELETTRKEILSTLARALEFRDDETGKHVLRMSAYCTMIAENVRLAHEMVRLIGEASSLHDVGKIGIPDTILLKPRSLTPQEFGIIKMHTTMGGKILEHAHNPTIEMAKSIAMSHHERWDGSGYPQGLKGEAIPIEGRISAIADVYDALTSIRPYRSGWKEEDALAYIRENSGILFDPTLVEAFLRSKEAIQEIRNQFQQEPSEKPFLQKIVGLLKLTLEEPKEPSTK